MTTLSRTQHYSAHPVYYCGQDGCAGFEIAQRLNGGYVEAGRPARALWATREEAEAAADRVNHGESVEGLTFSFTCDGD